MYGGLFPVSVVMQSVNLPEANAEAGRRCPELIGTSPLCARIALQFESDKIAQGIG
jgi:hypothetical protein